LLCAVQRYRDTDQAGLRGISDQNPTARLWKDELRQKSKPLDVLDLRASDVGIAKRHPGTTG
jgi:hypothetical protein